MNPQEEMHEEVVQESRILKVLRSEAGVIVGIIIFLFGIITPYFSIKQDIALIQKDISVINGNHEVHIQDILNEVEALKKENAELDKRLDAQYKLLLIVLQKEGYDITKLQQ